MQSEKKDLAMLLKNIEERLNKIEEKMSVSGNKEHSQIFHIKEVKIESLNLEELTYHLDKIDVKNLSGMLNLGNTFSPSVKPKMQNQEESSTKSTNNIESSLDNHDKKEEENESSPNWDEDTLDNEISVKVNGKTIIPKILTKRSEMS